MQGNIMKHLKQPTFMKKRRIAMSITQESIASDLEMAISSIGGIERGDNPAKKGTADKIAEILNAPFSTVFKPHSKLTNRFIAR
jgi:transcriptional regulator with XRE-family HTH domain